MAAKNQIARIVSYYIWYLIACLPFLILYLTKFNYTVKHVYVNENAPLYNYSNKPVIIAQISDVHSSEHFPNATKWLNKSLRYAHEKINPSWVLLSGDLVDNYVGHKSPTISIQTESHWILYNKAVNESEIPNDMIFEIYGNHDLWGLKEWNPKTSMPARYVRTEMPNLQVFSHERRDVRIVAFTPQEFPTGYGPFAFILAIKPKHLDLLEAELKKPTSCKYTVFTCHYTHELLYPRNAKSKSGLTLKEMLPYYNVSVYLNGHTHPKRLETVHFGNTMELTARATKLYDDLTLLSIDNNRINYKIIKPTKSFNAMVTHPAPQHLQAYNYKDTTFPINVVSFSPSKTKVFNITGDVEGQLQFSGYIDDKDMVALYSMNVTMDSGIHTIHVSGDLTEDVTFAVNCVSGPFKESQKALVDPKTGIVGFPMMIILYTIIVVFMWVPFPYFDSTADFILGKDSEFNYICLLLGPITVGRAISGIEIWLKILITVVVEWQLLLPILLYNFEGDVAALFSWGYVAEGKFVLDVFSFICGFIGMFGFISHIVLGGLIYACCFTKGWSFWHIFDIIVIVGTACYCYYFCSLYVAEIASHSVWVGSFTYFLLPVISIIVYSVSAVFRYKKSAVQGATSDTEKEPINDEQDNFIQP